MIAKRPRRTFDRILDVTLTLFNRFGEPNVSTSQLCGEMGISPGNLFYHHPTRDALVAALFQRYGQALDAVLQIHESAPPQPLRVSIEGPSPWWHALDPALARLIWLCEDLARTARAYRFLYRDLSDLVSRHRALEEGLPALLRRQERVLSLALSALPWEHAPSASASVAVWSGLLLASLTGCIGLDGALDPRERLGGTDEQVIQRSVGRALGTICPALSPTVREDLSTHLSRGDVLGSNPWWLRPSDG